MPLTWQSTPEGREGPRSQSPLLGRLFAEWSVSIGSTAGTPGSDRVARPAVRGGPAGELTVAYPRTRPLAVIPSAKYSPRQRLVSKYRRQRPTTSRRRSFSKAVAHGQQARRALRRGRHLRSTAVRRWISPNCALTHRPGGAW